MNNDDVESEYEAIAARFRSYVVGPEGQADLEFVQRTIGDAALIVTDLVPDGRERALALTKLEEAVFWANAAIARGER
jgi:hypothetical protein